MSCSVTLVTQQHNLVHLTMEGDTITTTTTMASGSQFQMHQILLGQKS